MARSLTRGQLRATNVKPGGLFVADLQYLGRVIDPPLHQREREGFKSSRSQFISRFDGYSVD